MTDAPTVDVHTHLAPLLSGPPVAGVARADDGRYVVDGHLVGLPSLYDADRLCGWLGSVGMDRGWVSVPPPFFRQGQGAGETAAWVGAVNDGLLDRVSGHPELEVLAYLPLDEPEVALAEVDRRSGMVTGWVGSAGGGSLPLYDARLAPLWGRLEDAGLPMLLHPGSSPDPRLGPYYLANLLGNPVETTVAAAELVFGDVLGAHPGLRLVLVHCGGGVPSLAGRWQRGLDTRRPGVAELSLGPRDAVRRFWVDTLAHDPAVVDLAAAVIGEEKLVLGSDWPFPMGLDDPRSAVAHLPATRRDQVARDNVRHLRGVAS